MNAFWDGKRMVLGDGDGQLFGRFTGVDIIGKEFGNAVVQHMTKLVYWGQSGALFDSLAVVFASQIKQYALRQPADKSDWILGAGLIAADARSRGLVSLAVPGTAYNDPRLGRDAQPAHMRDYVKTEQDNGGIHINSGIPNHAFYLTAISLGGFAWEKAGRIWYETIRQTPLTKNAQFTDFARATIAQAGILFGKNGAEAEAVTEAWRRVGVVARSAGKGRARKT